MADELPSMQKVFMEEIPKRLTLEKAKKVNACYQFKITGVEEPDWYMDMSKESDFCGKGVSANAKCVITVGAKEWVEILMQKLNPQVAFMSGKLKVSGGPEAMSLAMKLQNLLKEG